MAARSPRRTFAVPFVVTLAAAPACFTGPAQPASQPPSPHPQPPPADRPPDRPDIVSNPPHPSSPPAQSDSQEWTITQSGTTCVADYDIACPAHYSCNPPEPTPYPCPAGVTLPVKIVQHAGTCTLVLPPPACPPKAMCNPPPPKHVDCPKP